MFDEQMLNPRMGTHRMDKLGTFLDLDGKFAASLSAKSGKNNGKTANAQRMLAKVRARLCLVPEQQQPLWVLDELLEVEGIDTGGKQSKKADSLSALSRSSSTKESIADYDCWRSNTKSPTPFYSSHLKQVLLYS